MVKLPHMCEAVKRNLMSKSAVVSDTQEQAALSTITENTLPTGREEKLNQTTFSHCHGVLPSASTATDIDSIASQTASPVNEIKALFKEPAI